MKQNSRTSIFSVDTVHVGVLDGVRALGVLCVLWFHFWQQSWLMPVYQTPFLAWAGIKQINPDVLRRVGYLCVDLMLLLSAFVLYLPYARRTFCGTPVDSVKTFFKKRFARIVPSYLFAVLVMFAVAMALGTYKGRSLFAMKDLLTHLTFTQMSLKCVLSIEKNVNFVNGLTVLAKSSSVNLNLVSIKISSSSK